MPLLNPGRVVSSPYLSDDIVIVSRVQSVDDNGMVQIALTSRSSWAIVTVAGPNDLERLPESARAKRIMSFLTNDQVVPVARDNQPDLIQWPIDSTLTPPGNYVVLDVGAYPNYGEGWYQVLAASQDMVDEPL